MFTGIIQDMGEVVAIDKHGDWLVTIKTNQLSLETTQIGASIACSGICLTVIEKEPYQFKTQISAETLSKTTSVHWHKGTAVNLEPALRMGDELGGHLISGHVDGITRLAGKEPIGESVRYRFEVPQAFAKYIAPKGSITIDGVSLTVNDVFEGRFDVNLIPHTQNMTVLGALNIGGEVNFEIDMIARYVERMLGSRA